MPNDTISLNADVAPLNKSLDAAAKSLSDFANGPVADANMAIEDAVRKCFDAVSRTIARAATSGKTSMSQMVDAIIADLERVALKEFVLKPIENAVSSFASSIFSGARAAGGPVLDGAAYLVGEQGPELFVPNTSGSIVPNGQIAPPRPQIVLNVQARDAQSFLQSESQLAAMMSRALARGQRNM
jgi:phage-related minor tail protein